LYWTVFSLSSMKSPLLSGIIAASYTPFTADGELNLSLVPDLGRHLHRNGVAGAFVCGTTGEGAAMTTAERQRVVEAWAKGKPDGLRLIVHVGHNALAECVILAKHAARNGADAFAMLPPTSPRPATLVDLVDCCRFVAAAVPELPFYYYHMPAATGVNFTMIDFLRAAAARIPNLAGIKFTDENLMDFGQALAFDPERFVLLHGRDEILLSGLVLGAKGAVGSTYNYAAPIYHRVLRAMAAGDLNAARREQASAVKVIEIMVRHGGLPAGKAIMGLLGLDCGGLRLPFRALDPDARARLREDLESMGFFELIRLG
jgi:N-acetylneuraminate lyase